MTGPITKSVQEIAAALTEKGLRPTQQRIAIYDYLLRHPTHPTVDTIYRAVLERFPTFSRTTTRCMTPLSSRPASLASRSVKVNTGSASGAGMGTPSIL